MSAAPADAIGCIEDRRISVSAAIDRDERATLGQFFTPAPVADFMASLLDFASDNECFLLDAGAGIGSLTAAVARRAAHVPVTATCYELDPRFHTELRATLSQLHNVAGRVEPQDFIEHAVLTAAAGKSPGYTHAILNPPYRKISRRSPHRLLVRKLGLETSNLYTCFLACAVALCRAGAQIVAIVPRSFMNGAYFEPFRHWLLDRVSITHIHVFESRDRAFADDDVLQENVVLRMVVGARQEHVQVTACADHQSTQVERRSCGFDEIVTPDDAERVLHVPAISTSSSSVLSGVALSELGLDVCTGPVVDFRLREHLRDDWRSDAAPLLYASHFTGGFAWPRAGRKPNAIVRNAATEKWLMPKGCYVVLRRFTSKEEKRRIVAHVFDGSGLPGDLVGFENHLNVIHRKRRGFSPALARGLADYLNSQQVDDYFRTFSGHTQVNAADLRRLRYPGRERLEQSGQEQS